MAARFFHRLGASLLDRTICSSAGGEALAATYGAKIGMHVEHYAESRLILIWGSNSIASNLHFWTYAQAAKRAGAKLVCIDPRRTETAEKCHAAHRAAARHRRRARARPDARADRPTTGSTTTTSRATSTPTAGRRCASARSSGRPSARADVCGITPTRCASWRATTARRAPAAIRLNYGMQRVRGGGNAVRLIALLPCLVGAWRAPRRRPAAVELGLVPRCERAALQRPDLLAGRAPAHDQHEHDRRRRCCDEASTPPSARGSRRSSSTTATRSRSRPSRRRWCGASRATTCSRSCSSTS